MPPRTRTRATKMKENIDVVKKSKVKSNGKISKAPRKALADKTNSLSDDNASIDIPIKNSKKILKSKNAKANEDDEVRPRRQRRLPPRYIENQTLRNLSNSKESFVKQSSVTSKSETPLKNTSVKETPVKSTQDVKDLVKPGTSVSSAPKESKNKKESKSDQPTKIAQSKMTNFLTKPETRSRQHHPVQTTVQDSPKTSQNGSSLFKTPLKDAENSLVASRPKRLHRLPSRFEDHSISPNKFISVQPCHASTPIPQKPKKIVGKDSQKKSIENNYDAKTDENKIRSKRTLRVTKAKPINTSNTSISSIDKSSPDTNNNGKNKGTKPKRLTVKTKLLTKTSPDKNKPFTKRLLENSLSFRVFEGKKSNEKGLDVYEFTFDPTEEPPPKKKKKRPVKKRPPKPKAAVLKSNYDENVSKAIANLKSKVKPSQTKLNVASNIPATETVPCSITETEKNIESHAKHALEKHTENHVMTTENIVKVTENQVNQTDNVKVVAADKVKDTRLVAKPATSEGIPQSNYSANITSAVPAINESVNSIHASNYASMRVEDIAADFEFSDHQNDINYSPVNSPQHNPVPHHETTAVAPESNKSVNPNNKDPLNLQELSFFEEPPVASSSMNVSTRLPQASPWRIEFGSLPLKWHSNTYVKPNMTPAVECSFINSEITNKKHVYTNIVAEDDPLPEIFENAPPAAPIQTSILSFFKEVVEKKANKKKRRRSQSASAVDNVSGNSNGSPTTPKKAKLHQDLTPNTSYKTNDTSNDREKISKAIAENTKKAQSPEKKKKDKDCTYFGFDDSENVDQENVSPVKVNPNPKLRVLRSRNVLQEMNTQPMPTRAAMPVNAKAKMTSSEVVEQLYDQLRSAENAQLPVKETAKEADDTVATNVDDPSWHEGSDDSQSVHLFEDIEIVHHLKPHRKSYGKAKKVTFQQTVDSSDEQPEPDHESGSEDDLADLSFHLPEFKQTSKTKKKKKKSKKLLSKKEEREVEEWAAGFNSMCEDIDDFPLLVE